MAITVNNASLRGNSQEYSIVTLLSAVATGTSDAVDTRYAKSVNLVTEAGSGVSGGVITLEGAVSSSYAGTWVPLGTITTSAASSALSLAIGPSNDVTGNPGLPMPYMRARFTTNATGGTVTVYLVIEK